MRWTTTLTDDWGFVRDDIGLDAATRGEGMAPVELPHTWNAEDGQNTASYHRGACWYRFELPSSAGRHRFLELGAAGTVADVYIDGEHLAHHRGGFSAFRVPLGTADGTLVVRVDNSPTEDVYPLHGDHTIFGGLYRPVRLVEVEPLHLDLLDNGSAGVQLRQVELGDNAARLGVEVRIANESADSVDAAVDVRVVTSDRAPAAEASTRVAVAPGAVAETELELTVDRPRRWHARRDPHLYEVAVSIAGPDGPTDTAILPFGFRTFEVDPDRGALLNGEPYQLYGVSRHHDRDGVGPAQSAEQLDEDIEILLELGARAVRLAHYQHADEVYERCDRAGLAVWAEIPFNVVASTTQPAANAKSQMIELLRQTSHHPSILCWGLSNEITIGETTIDPRPIVNDLHRLVRALDPTRPTVVANLGQVPADDAGNRMPDLIALNLYSGWYYGKSGDAATVFDDYHAALPDVPIGLSEYGADASPGYHSDDPRPGDYTEEYQALLHEEYWQMVAARPWIWSAFVWNGFDFASGLRNEGGQRGRNMKGLVTHDRSVRKDAWWWYRANWSTEPVLHLCSKRFVNRHQAETTIKAYANVGPIHATHNGAPLPVAEPVDRVATWAVTLGDGTNEITVRAEADGDGGAEIEDTIVLELVAAPDPAYVCPRPRKSVGASPGADVENWYTALGIEADPTIYSTWTPLGELLDDPATEAVLRQLLPGRLFEGPMIEMGRAFTVDFIAGFAPDVFSDDKLRELHDRLSVIPKPHN